MATIQGREVPTTLLGALQPFDGDCSDGEALREAMTRDGYVYIQGGIDLSAATEAKEEVFSRLHSVGEIQAPAAQGIPTGSSRRVELHGDIGGEGMGRFWRSVSEGPALRRVTHGPQLHSLAAELLGEPARPMDMMYLRPVGKGGVSDIHVDFPFFARGSRERPESQSTQIYTCWVCFTDTELEDGPLMVLEDSQHWTDILEPIRAIDYDVIDHDTLQGAAFPKLAHPVDEAKQRGSRILTSRFRCG